MYVSCGGTIYTQRPRTSLDWLGFSCCSVCSVLALAGALVFLQEKYLRSIILSTVDAGCSLQNSVMPLCPIRTVHWGRLKRSARAVQLFGCLAILETHALRY